MRKLFKLCGGTVLGYKKWREGRNNQDAFRQVAYDTVSILLVADGVSLADGSSHNEVGAWTTINVLHNLLHNRIQKKVRPSHLLNGLCRNTLEALREIVRRTHVPLRGGSWYNDITNYYLSTVVGAIIAANTTQLFWMGDGAYWLNEKLHRLKYMSRGSAPMCLGYGLLGWLVDPRKLDFKRRIIPTKRIKSLIVATDGMLEMVDRLKPPISPDLLIHDDLFEDPRIPSDMLHLWNYKGGRLRRQTKRFFGDDATYSAAKRITAPRA